MILPDFGEVARIIRDAAVADGRQARIYKGRLDQQLRLGGDQATLIGGRFMDNEWVEGAVDGVLPLGVPPGLG